MTRAGDFKDYTGYKFGELVVESFHRSDAKYHKYWYCLCSCGKRKSIRISHLLSGNILSCGHIRDQMLETGSAVAVAREHHSEAASNRGVPSCDCEGPRKRPGNRMCRRHQRAWDHYRLTPEQYEAKKAAQNGNCDLCGTELADDINVDHCHSTGVVRGLVHGYCNTLIGLYENVFQVRGDQFSSYVKRYA